MTLYWSLPSTHHPLPAGDPGLTTWTLCVLKLLWAVPDKRVATKWYGPSCLLLRSGRLPHPQGHLTLLGWILCCLSAHSWALLTWSPCQQAQSSRSGRSPGLTLTLVDRLPVVRILRPFPSLLRPPYRLSWATWIWNRYSLTMNCRYASWFGTKCYPFQRVASGAAH